MSRLSNILPALTELDLRQESYIVATILSIRASAPQEVGAKILITKDGLQAGTIGGGKIENHVIQFSQKLLNVDSEEFKNYKIGQNHIERHVWNLQTDIGMSCGGEVEILFESHNLVPWEIHIFGAGHIAQALVPLLLTLDCRLHCYDSRAEWLERLPQSERLVVHHETNLATCPQSINSKSFVLLMTQGHATDLPVLKTALQKDREFAYLGVIGSKQKASKLRAELKNAAVAPEKIERFLCPMGLDLGSNTPPEIAISISSQLLQIRDQH